MDALGVLMMGAGAFLVYAAVKGEHPWTAFTGVLKSGVSPGATTSATTAPAATTTATTQPGVVSA